MSRNHPISLETRARVCEAVRYYFAHKHEGASQRTVSKQFSVPQGTFNEASQVATRPDLLGQWERGEITLYQARCRLKDGDWESNEVRRVKRLNKIREMADAGHHTEEIAQAVGLGISHLRELMHKNGIRIPEMVNVPHPKVGRILDETANGLAGYVIGLDSIDLSQITQETAREIAESLGKSLLELGRVYKQLKEIARGNDG